MTTCRRKETEKAAVKGKAGKQKVPSKKVPAKKTAATDGDEALAKSLTGRRESTRDRDKKGVKSKKAMALASLKEQRRIAKEKEVDESSDESDVGFGNDYDDSDEDYEEAPLKPWQKKARAAKTTVSRLDQHDDDSEDDMDIDEEEAEVTQKAKQMKAAGRQSVSEEAEANLEDFMKVTVPRRRLARWCKEPFFQAAVLECFVRLFIGEDDSGSKVYRLCEIIDVKTSNKSYKFPVTKKNEKPVSTNKTLRLKFGKSERDFPMYLVSDGLPEEIDVQKYIATQKNNRLPVLTKRRATKLRRLQNDLVHNYTYTTEDIERNLEQRRKQGKTASNLGSQQTKAVIAVQAARESVKDAERRVAEAKRALMEADTSAGEAELTRAINEAEKVLEDAKNALEVRLEEERATKDAVEDRRRRLAQRSKDMNWAQVNKRALEANQRADREALKLASEPKVSSTGKRPAFNPYARRKVKPKILWEVGQTREDGDEEEERKEEKTSEQESLKEKKGGTAQDSATPKLVHESNGKAAALLERHQFAIDEEGLAKSSTLDRLLIDGTTRAAPKRSRTSKGLSLAEYLDRKEKGRL